MLIIAGTITVEPGARERLEAAAADMMTETRREPGNLDYAFSVEVGNPGCVRIFECWESDGALDAHLASAHMAAFRAAIASLDLTSMGIQKYRIESIGPLFG